MRIKIGRLILSTEKAVGADLITHIPPSTVGWWPVIREGFTGAWQRSMVSTIEDTATHPTFWACLTLIAGDIAKCRPCLMQEDADGIQTEVDSPAYSPVIRRPNHYQNRIQFYSYWIISKLTRGNAYALKERDNRGVVTALYLLDPTRVRPMVSSTGDVYYACGQDLLSGVTSEHVVIPAREIIHDTMNALYHPLCGLSPVYACGHAAFQALTIMGNATRLFKNGSQIGGILTAPGQISEANVARLEKYWQDNYAGESNIGKVAVLGDGLKFDQPKVMSAVDAQLIDQLKWDDEKVCATLHVPGYKVGVGPLPSYNNVEALTQDYYGQCLQILIESLELCLTEGLELKPSYEVEFDIETLDRMDSLAKIEKATKGITGGLYKPNEGRKKFNLKPVPGGDRVYAQRQNWPLEDLGSDANPPPPTVPAVVAPTAVPSEPPTGPAKAVEIDAAELLDVIMRGLAA